MSCTNIIGVGIVNTKVWVPRFFLCTSLVITRICPQNVSHLDRLRDRKESKQYLGISTAGPPTPPLKVVSSARIRFPIGTADHSSCDH